VVGKKASEDKTSNAEKTRGKSHRSESLENLILRAAQAGRRDRPGPVSRQVAGDLMSGRLSYDPEKRQSWIVVSVAARPARKYRRAKLIEAAIPEIDVIGVSPDPVSIEQAQVTMYAALAGSEALFNVARRALESIRTKDPEVWEGVASVMARLEREKGPLFTPYPDDQPYHA
jgi:hypothetical protein